MVIIPGFQPGDGGSIPLARSNLLMQIGMFHAISNERNEAANRMEGSAEDTELAEVDVVLARSKTKSSHFHDCFCL